jgi:hypothetical protein
VSEKALTYVYKKTLLRKLSFETLLEGVFSIFVMVMSPEVS